jgi:hypothetical protein
MIPLVVNLDDNTRIILGLVANQLNLKGAYQPFGLDVYRFIRG